MYVGVKNTPNGPFDVWYYIRVAMGGPDTPQLNESQPGGAVLPGGQIAEGTIGVTPGTTGAPGGPPSG